MLKPLHPALQLLTAQPQLVLDHAGFYVDWLVSQLSHACARWRWRLILFAVAIASVGVAVVLAGVALMLAATMPAVGPLAIWVLVATPLFPLVLALACAAALRSKPQEGIIDQLKVQINEDMLMFREAHAP
jgi:hypothetical protein